MLISPEVIVLDKKIKMHSLYRLIPDIFYAVCLDNFSTLFELLPLKGRGPRDILLINKKHTLAVSNIFSTYFSANLKKKIIKIGDF